MQLGANKIGLLGVLALLTPAGAHAQPREEVRLQDAQVVRVKPTSDRIRLVAFGQPDGAQRLGTVQPGQAYLKVGSAGRAGRELTKILWRSEGGARHAYVDASALEVSPATPKYLVTASALNVRSQASARSARVQAGNGNPLQLKSGWVVPAMGQGPTQVGPESDGWVKVAYGGKTGYVSTKHLSLATNEAAVARPPRDRSAAAEEGAGAGTGQPAEQPAAAARATDGGGDQQPAARSTASNVPSSPSEVPGERSRRGFVQLPANGTGWYAYGQARKRWGTQRAIYTIMRVAAAWNASGRVLGIGNISLQNGGRMPPHQSHRDGIDIDVRPVRSDGARAAVSIGQAAYSRPLTRRAIELFRPHARFFYFNDTQISGVTYMKGHHNHFHVRVR